MTKKQLGIICTLLALIVCTAVLAAKLNNGGLNDPTDLSAVLSTEDEKNNDEKTIDTETISQQDFFIESRSEREQKDATTMQSLKAIADNQNTTAEQKASATDQLQKSTLKQDKQKTIELNIKNKGYVDAICDISEDEKKVSVIVKAEDGLNEKDGAIIQEIVQNAANIKDVTIEVKK